VKAHPVNLARSLAALCLASSTLLACPGTPDEPAPAGQQSPTLERVSRIGCTDCEGPGALTVLYLNMAHDGRILVLDLYEPFVRIFSPQGELLRAFGAAGQGPGELGVDLQVEYLPGIAVYPWKDASLLVHEVIPPTLTAFDSNGQFIEELKLEVQMRVPRAAAWNPEMERLYMLSFVPGEDLRVDRFDFAGRSSALARTVLDLAEAFPPEEEDTRRPATSLNLIASPDGGFAVAHPWQYVISRYTASGEVAERIVREIEHPLKSAAEVQEERELLQEIASQSGVAPEEPDPEAPHFIPRGALEFDDEGRLWVATNRGHDGVTTFDLFDSDGGYMGEVVMPDEINIGVETMRGFAIAGDYLAAVVVAEDGNHRIGVWRIVWA
jgi:hypothetical protein